MLIMQDTKYYQKARKLGFYNLRMMWRHLETVQLCTYYDIYSARRLQI